MRRLFSAALLVFAANTRAGELPVLRVPAEPHKFIDSVGHRAVLMGHEDGTFEVWIMPVKVLRDFRISVYFDGSLEPVTLADLAERVSVSPGYVTITHGHAAFTIRQTWVASLEKPAAAVLLDVDTSRPLRLRAAFTLEMKPMWPASFGGQASDWQERDHALVITEGLRRHAAVVGSPMFVRASEQVGHQLPDRTVLLEMDITPEIARRGSIPIVITGSGEGRKARSRCTAAHWLKHRHFQIRRMLTTKNIWRAPWKCRRPMPRSTAHSRGPNSPPIRAGSATMAWAAAWSRVTGSPVRASGPASPGSSA